MGALILVPAALRWRLIEVRGFNPDELEHLHFSWRISEGELPYRDYFDHHPPFLHYLAAPLVAAAPVADSPPAAWQTLFRARRVSWAFAAAMLAGTFWLALGVGTRRSALRGPLWLTLGAVVAPIVTLAWFTLRGALEAFLYRNVVVNRSWPGPGPAVCWSSWSRRMPC